MLKRVQAAEWLQRAAALLSLHTVTGNLLSYFKETVKFTGKTYEDNDVNVASGILVIFNPCPLKSLYPLYNLPYPSSSLCLYLVKSSGWQQGVWVCLRTAEADTVNHGVGGHSGASLRGCGPGPDSGMHCLPLPAASRHDHSLCQGDHGPLQCNPHFHMGGTALGWLTYSSIHMHSVYMCIPRAKHT